MATKSGNSVLIPILSKHEDNPDFLMQALQDADLAVLLVALDKGEMVGPLGFAAGDIRTANHLMQKIADFLVGMGKKTESVLEWGSVQGKILQAAELNRCAKIVLVRQSNDYYQKLVAGLKSATKIPIEEIEVSLEPAAKDQKEK